MAGDPLNVQPIMGYQHLGERQDRVDVTNADLR
jgi:hypothetical protein